MCLDLLLLNVCYKLLRSLVVVSLAAFTSDLLMLGLVDCGFVMNWMLCL